MEDRYGGGTEARLALVEATRDSLFRYLRRMVRDEAVAEELFQETYLRAFRALASFRGESSPTTWVLTIARNLALNRIRRQRTESAWRVVMDEPPDVADPRGPAGGGEVGEAAREALLDRRLLEALDRLTPPQREAVLLFYLEDRPVDEVARMTNRPVNTIKSDLRRARLVLREALDDSRGRLDDAGGRQDDSGRRSDTPDAEGGVSR